MVADAPEVLGQYTILERLGRGGMATVNRAEMRGLAGFRKIVALKRLHPHVAKDPDMVQSFVHEARLASHLHHPNIAQTYDLGKVDKTYFIAMEYVAGPTLTQLLKQSAVAAGPVPIPIALSILGQLCDALDYAHNLCDDDGRPLNLVHRDVSPSNIIISTTGVVKLIDFGIAKAAGSENTKTGYVKGKFAYMAPEYLQGQLDLRADLFGLGVIAHEMLAGRTLFLAKNDYETMTRLREMPVQPPSRWNPDVPRDLDDIVLTALQRSPELRWQSAAAMRTAIANVVQASGGPVTSQQVLEWIEWAFKREPPEVTSSLGRVIDQLAEPSRVTGAPGAEPDAEPDAESEAISTAALTSFERPPGEPERPRESSGARTRAKPPAAQAFARPPAPRGSRRVWGLLLVLIVLAVLTRDQLEVMGRALYDWVAG